ncbi:MAG: hypothetical protein H6901_08525 [Rhodobacteraceae bacterium]|nr:hypothetical protein [Paracoccaceae bacterium]MCP5342245.1 hypothetical protein [Paracoccaceae bacterium]
MIRMLCVLGLAVAGHAALARSDDDFARARAEIEVSAAAFCRTRPISAASGKVRLTDEANAELSSLLKVLEGYGFDASDTYEQDDSPARSALALAIAQQAGCEDAVFASLAANIFGPQAGSAKSGAGSPTDALIDQAQGYWHSARCRYGFVIEGAIGRATLSNAPRVYAPGDTMLLIDDIREDVLGGRQIFTDGTWYTVQISRQGPNVLHLEGGGFKWDMYRYRPDPDGSQKVAPPCAK